MVQDEESVSRSFLVSLVALAFGMNLVARGVPETFAVFLLPVQKGLSLSRAEITLTYSTYMVTYGVAGPFVGQLVDRVGARFTYGLGLACLGVGYVLAGFVTQLWQYLLCVGLLGGIGAAMLGMIVASALLSRWFVARIGSIMSLPYAAIGVGMLIMPPLTQVLLSYWGWRTTHQILGCGVLAILPFAMLMPLGRMSAGSSQWRAARRPGTAAEPPPSLAAILKTSAFWGLFAAYLFTSVAAYSVLPHSVAYLVERGFDPLMAAGAFGFTGMLSAIGIIMIGWLSDRIGRRQAATLSYCFTLTGITSLTLVSVWPVAPLVYGFVLFFGLMQGARGPVFVAMVASLFPRSVGGVFGALSVAQGAGAGLASWGSGLLYQLTGSYVASFMLAMVGAILGLSMFWVIGSLRDSGQAARTPAVASSADEATG